MNGWAMIAEKIGSVSFHSRRDQVFVDSSGVSIAVNVSAARAPVVVPELVAAGAFSRVQGVVGAVSIRGAQWLEGSALTNGGPMVSSTL